MRDVLSCLVRHGSQLTSRLSHSALSNNHEGEVTSILGDDAVNLRGNGRIGECQLDSPERSISAACHELTHLVRQVGDA